jgi:hypothetical protein
VLHGAPAAALAEFAHRLQVTEIVLARVTGTAGGRHPLLRDLARAPREAELHVLPG